MDASETSSKPTFCVISGGTGCNALCGAFLALGQSSTFVLPISDNGGSSSEIIRVLGGPSIGDIRSRLVRLIPTHSTTNTTALAAIKALFEYRLSGTEDAETVKREWSMLVEGRHRLWNGVPLDRKECIRAYLVHFEHAILKRASRRFDFRNASVGNIWLAAALLFFRSLQSAIFLFTSSTCIPMNKYRQSTTHRSQILVTGIPESTRVLPVINTSSIATIAAQLEDDSIIVGQCEISHPSPSSSRLRARSPQHPLQLTLSRNTSHLDNSGISTPFNKSNHLLFAQPPVPTGMSTLGGLFTGRKEFLLSDEGDALGNENDDDNDEGEDSQEVEGGNLVFSKEEDESNSIQLSSPIKRIYYINQYGHEIFPKPNPLYILSLQTSTCLIYACGSLFTSIIPCISLIGMAHHISNSPTLKFKIMLLNTQIDRETFGYINATQFVKVIHDVLESTCPSSSEKQKFQVTDFISHLMYIEEGAVKVDVDGLKEMGIESIKVEAAYSKGRPVFDEANVQSALSLLFSQ